MKKLLVIFLSLTLLISCSPKQKKISDPKKTTVKIGVICALTGGLTYYGEDLKEGILLAQKELSKDTKFNYEVIFEDDSFECKKTALAVQKLIHTDKVDCLISMFGSPGLVVNPIAEQNKTPHFGIAYAHKVADGFYNFNHWPHMSVQVKPIIDYLKKSPYQKIAMITLAEPGDLSVRKEFLKQFPLTGKKLVCDEIFVIGERNFDSLLMKLKKSGAEILFNLSNQPELDVFMRQMRAAGMNHPVCSLNCFRTIQDFSLYEGSVYSDRDDPTEDFIKKFSKVFHHKPGMLAPNGYDIFNLIIAAYEKSPSSSKPSHEEIVKLIHASPRFEGALGTTEIDSEGIFSAKFILKQIKNGKPVIFKK